MKYSYEALRGKCSSTCPVCTAGRVYNFQLLEATVRRWRSGKSFVCFGKLTIISSKPIKSLSISLGYFSETKISGLSSFIRTVGLIF